jgi:hypothetical protein
VQDSGLAPISEKNLAISKGFNPLFPPSDGFVLPEFRWPKSSPDFPASRALAGLPLAGGCFFYECDISFLGGGDFELVRNDPEAALARWFADMKWRTRLRIVTLC